MPAVPGSRRPGGGARGALLAGLLAVCPITLAALAYPHGPPVAHAGGFGDPTCRACHTGGALLGAADGEARIGGLPDAFEPGRTYDIVIEVARPGLRRAGFEVAVRFAPGTPSAGLQAGRLAPVDSAQTGVDLHPLRRVQFGRHTLAGTRPQAPGAARWRLAWTAPAERQAVVFHAAMVAANDDNSNQGDEVYARAQVLRAGGN